jgi:ABC-type transport system substrate-binding protein
MRRLLFLFVLGVSLTFGVGCQRESAEPPEKTQLEPQKGGTYRAALPWSPRNLDPAFSTDIYSVTLIQQLFEGLVEFDRSLNIAPAVATNWNVSADGRTYTFHLRDDVTFHNGRPVTADDFVYSFTRILDPSERASALSFFEKIEGAKDYRSGASTKVEGLKALDSSTLEITLKEPFAPFLSVLAMKSSKVVPREEVERWGKDFGHHPVGTGPFRFESWEASRIVLGANHNYHEGRPHLAQIVYTVYEGSQNEKIFQDFQAGLLEEATVFGANRERMSQTTEYQFFRKPTLSLLFYGMNCTRPPLMDPRVRQALNYAINKAKIVHEYVKDQFVAATTILPPGMPGYTPENAAYAYDPEKAKTLLRQAGYGPSQKKLSLTILSASKSKLAQQELTLVAANLAAVGVELKFQYETDWPTFEATLSSGNFELYRYSWIADIPDPDNFLKVLSGSNSRYNFMRYSNPEVDRILAQALAETDILKRVKLYRAAERITLSDAPMIPWLYLTFESVFQPYVKGLEISALGRPYIPLKKIWLAKY